MEDIDHEYTREIVCPYCGYEDGDSWEEEHNDGEKECGRCSKNFFYERQVEVTYSTSKDCELNKEEHEYTADPVLGDNHTLGKVAEDGKTYVKCLKCEETRFI